MLLYYRLLNILLYFTQDNSVEHDVYNDGSIAVPAEHSDYLDLDSTKQCDNHPKETVDDREETPRG